MKKSRLIILLVLIVLSLCPGQAARQYFYTLNTQQGLSDNTVLQLLQLSDGRLVIRTERGVNIYDGQSFHFLPLPMQDTQDIPQYGGQTHLYVDSSDRLWVKSQRKVWCIDLRRFKLETHSLKGVLQGVKAGDIRDLYVDAARDLWCVVGSEAVNVRTRKRLRLQPEWGVLQDLEVNQGHVYTFHAKGVIASFVEKTQQLEYTMAAYGKDDAARYHETSLVVKGKHGQFYQVRSGHNQSVFLRFDAKARQYEKVFSCQYILHTLMMSSEDEVLISCPQGYLLFNFRQQTVQPEVIRDLFLPDGTSLTTGVNTILKDLQGGLWLGTYDKGLLYTSPLLGLFNMRPIDISVSPILTNIYLEGKPITQDQAYDGKVLQAKATAYVDSLSMGSQQNDLAFQFCTMNYVYPRGTYYRYRLNGEPWHTVSADSAERLVDNKGVLYLSFLDLKPGSYELEVMATVNPSQWKGKARTIHFTIAAPWWRTWWMAGFVVVLGVLALVGWYLRRRNRVSTEDVSEPSSSLSDPEKEFIAKATSFVEQHLSDADYGVEQLAQDLCMERTGLYKKLTALVDTTPVAFIRDIRLHRAAEMIRQGEKGILEISVCTGFTSPSYFAKCFKTKFGVKPSEYR